MFQVVHLINLNVVAVIKKFSQILLLLFKQKCKKREREKKRRLRMVTTKFKLLLLDVCLFIYFTFIH